MPRGLTPYNPPMDPVAEIKKLYYAATKATIQADLTRAIELMKALPTDEERERAAVYMDGLSQMRSEWKAASGAKARPARPKARTTSAKSQPSSAPRAAAAPARSDRSTPRAGRGRSGGGAK